MALVITSYQEEIKQTETTRSGYLYYLNILTTCKPLLKLKRGKRIFLCWLFMYNVGETKKCLDYKNQYTNRVGEKGSHSITR